MNEVMVVNETTAWEYINKWVTENEEATELDVLVWLRKKGLPQDVIMEFMRLYKEVKVVGNRTIHIGKLIIAKIIEFVEQHQTIAIGLAVGAAVWALFDLIPNIKSILGPVMTAVLGFLGIINRFEITRKMQVLIAIANDFLKFFSGVINFIVVLNTGI